MIRSIMLPRSIFECTTGILCREISSFFSEPQPPPTYPSSSALSPCPAAHSQTIKHAAWRGFSLCSQAKSLSSRKKGGKKRNNKKKKPLTWTTKLDRTNKSAAGHINGWEWDIFPAKCSRISFSWSPGGASAGRHFLASPSPYSCAWLSHFPPNSLAVIAANDKAAILAWTVTGGTCQGGTPVIYCVRLSSSGGPLRLQTASLTAVKHHFAYWDIQIGWREYIYIYLYILF